jgi:hypothetical protein
MKKILLIVLTLSFRGVAHAQGQTEEHAPTVAQCQADLAAWYNAGMYIEYNKAEAARPNFDTPNRSPINKIPLTELSRRRDEMADCFYVDSSRRTEYRDAMNLYDFLRADRFKSFVLRHNLLEQLIREDAAGER